MPTSEVQPETLPMPEPSASLTRAYAHVSPRGLFWRVRLTADGVKRPLWRLYLRADYPSPEDAARRAARHLPQPVRLAFHLSL